MRYSKGFLRSVAAYLRCATDSRPPRNDKCLRQFWEFESRGAVPENPTPFFVHLCNGKKWFEWTINEYAKLYHTGEWPGWYQLERDFCGTGRKWILRVIRARTGASSQWQSPSTSTR